MKTAPIRRFSRTAAACLLALFAAGCMSTGKFSCPAPDGVACMSSMQIYEMTNGYGQDLQPAPATKATKRKARRGGKVATHQVGATGDALALSAPVQADTGAARESALSLGGPARGQYMPVGGSESIARVPAKVMRIWLAPWTDTAGDLHMPGYVYSEVSSRRWSIGGDVRVEQASNFDPHGPWLPKGGSQVLNP